MQQEEITRRLKGIIEELDENDSTQRAVSCILCAIMGAIYHPSPMLLRNLHTLVFNWSKGALEFLHNQKALR